MQLDILRNYLNKRVFDIYVTGYSEIRENYHYFSEMNWWYYIEFENSFLCLASRDDNPLVISIEKDIKCNFEIEQSDVFTVTSIAKKEYTEIQDFDLFYRNGSSEIFAFGIKFCNDDYIFFDSLNWGGIKIGNMESKINYLRDNRFGFVKIS